MIIVAVDTNKITVITLHGRREKEIIYIIFRLISASVFVRSIDVGIGGLSDDRCPYGKLQILITVHISHTVFCSKIENNANKSLYKHEEIVYGLTAVRHENKSNSKPQLNRNLYDLYADR